MSSPHVLVMPGPAQGHVIPLLEFSQCLAKHGFRVTFVNTDYYHKRVVESLQGKNYLEEQIRLVSIPDGMEPWEDRNDFGKLIEKFLQVMPRKLEELIEEINSREDEKIDCFIADGNMGWSLEVAKKMNVRGGVFWSSSAASVALVFRIPKLIDDGIIDSHGTPMSMQMFLIAPNMPEMNSRDCFWAHIGDLTTQKIFFDLLDRNTRAMRAVNFHFCNSTYELESEAFTMFPELLPIGPLTASNRQGNSAGYFWREDSNCLKWLDQQQPSSVIYAAFGSLTILDQVQFQEFVDARFWLRLPTTRMSARSTSPRSGSLLFTPVILPTLGCGCPIVVIVGKWRWTLCLDSRIGRHVLPTAVDRVSSLRPLAGMTLCL
ncbi:UDP-glycosyltransferase 83A1 [Citrus sinensis]|nr:UDP-glycosyltransferase 83A1 [Citrus sinensis]